jgi:hypothetical protein
VSWMLLILLLQKSDFVSCLMVGKQSILYQHPSQQEMRRVIIVKKAVITVADKSKALARLPAKTPRGPYDSEGSTVRTRDLREISLGGCPASREDIRDIQRPPRASSAKTTFKWVRTLWICNMQCAYYRFHNHITLSRWAPRCDPLGWAPWGLPKADPRGPQAQGAPAPGGPFLCRGGSSGGATEDNRN